MSDGGRGAKTLNSLINFQFNFKQNSDKRRQSGGTCEEGLGEVETGDPEHGWNAVINPILEELQSVNKSIIYHQHFHISHSRNVCIIAS